MAKHTKQLEDDVKQALRDATWGEDSLGFGPPGSLPRDLYDRTMKVVSLAGFKWNRGKQSHVGTAEGIAALRAAMEDGAIVDKVKQYQFYPTVPAVADAMVSALFKGRNSSEGWILEPSAGDGGLVRRLHSWNENLMDRLDVVEIDPAHETKLRNYDPNQVIIGDFLDWKHKGHYEHIIANPPFAEGRDLKHFTAMLGRLNRGGRLVCLVSCTAAAKAMALVGAMAREFGLSFKCSVSEPITAGDTTDAKSVMVIVDL